MNFILKIFDSLYSFGFIVVLPILFLMLGMRLGLGINRSLRSGALVAASLFGVSILVNRLGSEMLTAAQQIAERFGLSSDVANISFSSSSALAFGSGLISYIIPACLLLNLLLVAAGLCRTFSIDIWNMWRIAFIGALVQSLTGSDLYGVITSLVGFTFVLVLADMSAPAVERFTGIEGAAISQGFVMSFLPVAWGANKLIDLIPGQKKKAVTFSSLTERFGVLGEPALWGAVLGILLGVLAGQDVFGVAQLGAVYAAVIVLLPVCLKLFHRGYGPVASAMIDRVNARRRTKGRVNLGFSATLGLMEPTVILVAMALLPAALILYGYIPGVRMLPVGDASMLIYIVMMAVILSGGRIVRSLVSGALSVLAALWCGSSLAGLFTQAVRGLDYEKYGTMGVVNTLADGSSPLAWLEAEAASYGHSGIALLIFAAVLLLIINRNRIAEEHKRYQVEMGLEIEPVAGDMRHWTNYLIKSAEAKKARNAKAASSGEADAAPEIKAAKPAKKTSGKAKTEKKGNDK